MTERIRLLMEAQNLTASQFADRISVQRSGLSHIMSGRNKASLDFVQKVLSSFPEVSPDWLINGKGPMMRTGSELQGKPVNPENDLMSLAFAEENDSSESAGKQQKGEDIYENRKIPGSEGRKTERVIIFYDDGTFTDYRPQQ